MTCTITDKLVTLGADGTSRPLPRGVVYATPSAVPVYLNNQLLSNPVPTTQSDAAGNWTLIMPWQSETSPANLTWQIVLPDGTIYGGTVPAGQAGPFTIYQLVNSYSWGLVAGSGSNPINTVTGPQGPSGAGAAAATNTALGTVQLDQNPASGNPIVLTVPRLAAASGVASLDSGTHVPLAQLSGITTTQLAATAAIVAAQLDSGSGNSGKVLTAAASGAPTWQTAAGGAPSGAASGDLGSTYPNPTVVSIANVTTGVLAKARQAATTVYTDVVGQIFNQAPASTVNYGLLNLGSAPFDGTSAGHYAAVAGSTALAFNMATGFTGNFIEGEVAGSTKFYVDNNGIINTRGGINATPAPVGTANYGVVNIGNQPFDGATAGYFKGFSQGTYLAINGTNSGSGADLMRVQRSGIDVFRLASDGTTIFNGNPTYTAVPAAGYPAISIGTVANFSGGAVPQFQGTAYLAVNGASAYTGNLLDMQQQGVSKFQVDYTGALAITPATTTTAPGAGGAGALPATPAGYLTITINTVSRKIPYY